MAVPTRRAEGRVWSAWARLTRSSGRRCATGKAARAVKQDFRRPRGAGRAVAPMRDEPDAGAGSPRRQVRLFTMAFTVRRPHSRRAAAEAKTNVLRIADRKVAAFYVKRGDRRCSRAQVGEGGHFGARGGGLFRRRRRLDEGGERLGLGAVRLSGDEAGG